MYCYVRKLRDWTPQEIGEANKARSVLTSALAAGRILRPLLCQECGVECTPSGHHDDYSKPLEVRWLCRKCHGDADREMRKRLRSAD